jgi:hypothetical protein
MPANTGFTIPVPLQIASDALINNSLADQGPGAAADSSRSRAMVSGYCWEQLIQWAL